MSQQQVTIQITAKDGASQTFQAVGKAATGMSSTAQTAASKTTGSLNQISTSAKSTETAVGGIGRGFNVVTGAAAGLIGSAVVGFLSDSARAAAESEAVMARLAVAVDNTGASYDELAPRIDATVLAAQNLSFDDEDAADALATLTAFTGDASEAMDLLGVTMDIARGKGVSLASASQAVGKAATGQVAALSRMGVAVEEGATAQEALAAAQQTFAGQAEAYSETTAGAFDRLTTTLGNFRESIGGMLGPAQLLIGVLPGLSSGFGMLSGTIGGLQGAGGLGGLAATMNPLVLGIGAVTVGVGLLVGAFVVAEKGAKDLADSLIGMKTALSDVTFLSLNEELGNLAVSAGEVGAIRIDGFLWEADGKVAEFNRTLGETVNVLQDTGSSVGEFSLVFGQLDAALLGKNVTLNQSTKALEDYRTVLENTGPGAAAATSQLGILNRAFIAGIIGPEEYQAAIGELVTTLPMFDDAAVESAGNVAAAQREMTTSIVGTRQEFDNYVVSANNRIRTDEILAQRVKDATSAEEDRLAAIVAGAPTTDRYTASIAASTEAWRLQGQAILAAPEAANKAADELAAAAEAAGRDAIATARDIEQDTVNAAESASDKIISAREREARGSINAVESAGKAEVRAVEQAGDARIREATRIENKTVMVAEAAADSRVAAAEAAEERIVSAVETAADSRIASAQRAEDATVSAAERAATAQIQSATAAATAASQIVDQQVSAAEAAADRIVASATQAASDAEAAANKDSEDEYDKKTDRANKHYDQAVRSAERSGGKITNDEQKRLNDMEKRRDQAIDRATDHQIQAEQEAARAREEAVRQAEARALAIREEAARQGAIAEEGIANKLELAKQAAAERTEAVATAAAERTAAVEAEQAAIVATAREQAAANTAAVQKAANEDVELAARAAARATEIVRREAVRAIRDQEAQTANEIRVINRTTAQIQRDEARSVAEATEAAADRRIAAENRVRDNNSRPGPGEADPLDGPPARQLGGMVRREDVSQLARIYPTAAGGRTVLVGEAGPELAFLPYGTQVMPSTPSQSRMTSDSAGGGGMRFYGAVHIHAASPDIAREIERNLVTRSRA